MGVFSWMESSVPFVVMVLAVTALATNMIVSKLAMSSGTSFFILSVYSNALATLILFPCGFIFHRLVAFNFTSFPPKINFLVINAYNYLRFCSFDYGCIPGTGHSCLPSPSQFSAGSSCLRFLGQYSKSFSLCVCACFFCLWLYMTAWEVIQFGNIRHSV